jgi:5-formyltetrahydrofolate cyclo-ligase
MNWGQVRCWRKDQRVALVEQRLAIPREDRIRWSSQITLRQLNIKRPHYPDSIGLSRGYDPRAVAQLLHAQHVALALPVVIERRAPLVFRAWHPEARLVSGVWGIPVPADGETVQPAILLVPLVGYDQQAFRLGYGGGFYDRTLATMSPRPFTIGVGSAQALLATIHPQQHDIPMDMIITN